jgi:Holliday junction resolvasome RuvABC endonuclease subunit
MTCGIDYSMTSPAACKYTPSDSTFWYANETKEYSSKNLVHFPITTSGSTTQRAARLARGLLAWYTRGGTGCDRIGIEDYAFAATGRVFHIGENAGLLKYFLEEASYAYHLIPPTVIKKFATGKGNADKVKMTAAFLAAYPPAQAWITKFFPRANSDSNVAKSPLADLADAYWIARYTYEIVA